MEVEGQNPTNKNTVLYPYRLKGLTFKQKNKILPYGILL